MAKISAVVIVLNGGKTIDSCLKSLDWVDELIVVDDGSTDTSVEIASNYTKFIYHHKSQGYVEPARNLAISKATGDYILVVDADENIPPSLATKLISIAKNEDNTPEVVLIPRKNMIFGTWIRHTGWWPDYQVRFFKKGSVTWSDKIHSMPITSGKELRIDAIEENAIFHSNYESVEQFVSKTNQYTTVHANESREITDLLSQIVKNPTNAFIDRYFAKEGYKDGMHGFMLSQLMAFYEFLILAKNWENQGFKEKGQIDLNILEHAFKKSHAELLYWFAEEKMKHASNPVAKVVYRLKKRQVAKRIK